MAWATPDSARATGYVVTAANWNELAADLKYLKGQDGMIAFESGAWFNDTANANMTLGVTINQGSATDTIFALKQSTVAHGITTLQETDTFARFAGVGFPDGGVMLEGLSGATVALYLRGSQTTATTTKSTAGQAAVEIVAALKSGTGIVDVGADGNLATIKNNATTRFIFDAEGSAHADVEWITFDAFDDVALLGKLDAAMTQDPIKTQFGRFLADYRQELQVAKIANFYSPDGPRAMVNFTRLSMLLVGAVRQLGDRLQLAEQRLAALPGAR